jgi:hypothetical protein
MTGATASWICLDAAAPAKFVMWRPLGLEWVICGKYHVNDG